MANNKIIKISSGLVRLILNGVTTDINPQVTSINARKNGQQLVVRSAGIDYRFEIPGNTTTLNYDGGDVDVSSQHVDSIISLLYDNVFPANTGSGGSGSVAPYSNFGGFGDSIVGSAYATRVYQDVGFVNWAAIFSGGRLYQPAGNVNGGVGGNTTTQMIARLGATLALNHKIIIVLGGTNDALADYTVTTTNLNKIYNAFIANGAIVIALTIPPKYSSTSVGSASSFSGAQNAQRALANTWIKSQAGTYIKVIDIESIYLSQLTTDGTHPDKALAYQMGQMVATIINTLTNTTSSADYLQIDTALISNLALAGTGGVMHSGTGTSIGVIADSFESGVDFSGGATLTGSKTTDNGLNQQVLTISGNYNGSNNGISFYQNYTPSGINGTDTLEAILDFEILAALPNINTIQFILTTTVGGTTSGVYALNAINQSTAPFEVGKRYQMRTPPWTQGGSTMTNVNVTVNLSLKNVGVSTPLSGAIKIHKMGARKVPANILAQ